jgi:hypothetical protein
MPNLNAEVTPIVAAPSSSSEKLYAAGALPLAMEPADLWAIANLRFKELPPVEFDRPSTVPVLVIDIDSEAELRERCGWTDRETSSIMVGCAMRFKESCRIYLGPPQTEHTGVTRNIVLRHETGHCSGWPADHPGMR